MLYAVNYFTEQLYLRVLYRVCRLYMGLIRVEYMFSRVFYVFMHQSGLGRLL